MLFLNPFFEKLWQQRDPFREASALSGETFREVKNRRTFRIELGNKGYFVKLHRGVGWKEVLKNLFQFKLPVTDAGNEFRAIRKLEELGVSTMTPAACGVRGWNPAARESFLITEELQHVISLEDLAARSGAQAVPPRVRANLIRELGRIAGIMHRGGVNHRDCYICHFLLKQDTAETACPELFVIDLHRAQIRKKVPYRYLVKDIAGLWFSAMDACLSKRERLRFIRAYEGASLPEIFASRKRFWLDADRSARKLYRKIHGHNPPPDPS